VTHQIQTVYDNIAFKPTGTIPSEGFPIVNTVAFTFSPEAKGKDSNTLDPVFNDFASDSSISVTKYHSKSAIILPMAPSGLTPWS
jgi:hypothetical protein